MLCNLSALWWTESGHSSPDVSALACLHMVLLEGVTYVCCGALALGHVISDLALGLETFCSSSLVPADFWPSQEQCLTKADLTDRKTTDNLLHCPVPISQHHWLRNYPDLISPSCWREKGSRAKHKWPCCILFSSVDWLCKYKFMGGGASAEAVTVGFFSHEFCKFAVSMFAYFILRSLSQSTRKPNIQGFN